MELTVCGQVKHYRLHHVLEFDSGRKRMSVIVEDEQGLLKCSMLESSVSCRTNSLLKKYYTSSIVNFKRGFDDGRKNKMRKTKKRMAG